MVQKGTTDASRTSRQVGAALCSKARRRSPSHKRRGTSAVQGSLSPPACGPTGSTPRVNHRRPSAWYPMAAHRQESPQPARPGERATPRGRTPASQPSARGRRAAPRGVAPLTPRALNRVPQPPRAEGACKETGKQRLAGEGPRSAQKARRRSPSHNGQGRSPCTALAPTVARHKGEPATERGDGAAQSLRRRASPRGSAPLALNARAGQPTCRGGAALCPKARRRSPSARRLGAARPPSQGGAAHGQDPPVRGRALPKDEAPLTLTRWREPSARRSPRHAGASPRRRTSHRARGRGWVDGVCPVVEAPRSAARRGAADPPNAYWAALLPWRGRALP